MFKLNEKEKKIEQLIEELLPDITKELLESNFTSDESLKLTNIFAQDSPPDKAEIDVQTYLEKNYSTLADKVSCEFLNLGTKNENNPDGLEEIKLTGSLDLTGFSNLKIL